MLALILHYNMFSYSALILLAFGASAIAQSGSGTSTRYWDCCKTSCAWSGKASVTSPVGTCDASDRPLSDPDAKSGCDGGSAYACTNNSPFAVDDNTAYGFAAVNIAGSNEAAWCCQCYELTFTSTSIAGKKMIVQATNTGGDLGGNQFDLMIPGGGVGIFNGCASEFGSWDGGAQYGGVSSREECSKLPSSVQAGCQFRFDWFEGADNPTLNFQAVACPSQLTSITGCSRT